MKRILISWIASNNDFKNNLVNKEGPTFRFHQNFYNDYDKHVLLSSEKDGSEISKGLLLFSALAKEFPSHKTDLRYLDIPDKDVVNFNRIHSIVYPICLELAEYGIDIFISPGTPTMQVVWYFIYLELKSKIRLFQTIKPEDSETGIPELIEVQFNQTPKLEFLIIQENKEHSKSKIKSSEHQNYLITDSLKPIYRTVEEIALTQKTSVLIHGDTGTGKEHIAKEIHSRSNRKGQPFISVNCAAMGSDLLESRLFGYEKGAFSNALKTTDGYFQAANKGTIFLDEIGDITPYTQISLLRILQEGEIQKVGSTKTEKVDVRLITATNKNLYEECEKGNFRWDLFYRICVAEISLPSLKARGRNEIISLLDFFNHIQHRNFNSKRSLIKFTASSMCKLPQK